MNNTLKYSKTSLFISVIALGLFIAVNLANAEDKTTTNVGGGVLPASEIIRFNKVIVENGEGKIIDQTQSNYVGEHGTVSATEVRNFDKRAQSEVSSSTWAKVLPATGVVTGTVSPSEIRNEIKKIQNPASSTDTKSPGIIRAGTLPPNEVVEFNKVLIQPEIGSSYIFTKVGYVTSGIMSSEEQAKYLGTTTLNKKPIVVQTADLISVSDNKVYIKGDEIKVTPNEIVKKVSDIASGQTINKIELIKNPESTSAPVYNVSSEKNVKFLRIFNSKMSVTTQINSQTGETEKISKPWWSFLASGF